MKTLNLTACLLGLAVACAASDRAATDEPSIDIVVGAGRPLSVALDEKVRLKKVGQLVTGTLAEDLYSYDRIVVPAGTKVTGHIDKLEGVPKGTRLRAMLGGDFTPLRKATVQFDALVFDDGRKIPIRSRVTAGTENASLDVAGASEKKGKLARVGQAISRRVDEAVAPIKAPGKLARLKDWFVGRLPYHPQYLRKGTVYTVELLDPLNFGTATPMEWAPPDTLAPPGSVLNARIVTPLDSATSVRAMPIQAVLTRPLLSADNQLILPEGTELRGEVTFATRARWLHRNGQLRFLFESVKLPEQDPQKLLASLHSVELSRNDDIAVDEEGGMTVTNSKTRFIAPALAALAAVAALGHGEGDHDSDSVPGGGAEVGGGGFGGSATGGFFGLSILGVALSQTSKPVAVVLSFFGLARRAYAAVFGKGREVVIPANTRMQLQLSPVQTQQ